MSTLIFLAVWLVLISSSDRKQNILNSVEKKGGLELFLFTTVVMLLPNDHLENVKKSGRKIATKNTLK